MLRAFISYGFCFAILQLLIACGPAPIDQSDTAVDTEQSEQPVDDRAEAETLILAFGDSLYAGYGLPQQEGFVPELEDALRADRKSVV